MVSFQIRRWSSRSQEMAPGDVYSRSKTVARGLVLFALLFSLSGCSWVQSFWHKGETPVSLSFPQQENHTSISQASVPGSWQVDPEHQQELTEALHSKQFLVVPVMNVLESGELLPDYVRSAKLYDGLKRAGLKLVRAELSLKWHYQMIAAVEDACPEHAIDPLPSCTGKEWLSGWLPDGDTSYYSPDVIAHFLNKYNVDYLIVPDPSLYNSNAVLSLRYAPSSSPVVAMNHKAREQSLAPLGDDVSLTVMKVQRSWLGNISDWEHQLAICRKSLPYSDSSVESLIRVRPPALDKLRDYCTAGIAGLLQ